MVPPKYNRFCARLGPCRNRKSLQGLFVSTKKNLGSNVLFTCKFLNKIIETALLASMKAFHWFSYSTDQKKPNRERLTERVLFPFHTRSRSRSVSVPFPFCIRSLSVPYPFRSRSVSVQCCSVPALLAFDL